MSSAKLRKEEQALDYTIGQELFSQRKISLKRGQAIAITNVIKQRYGLDVSAKKVSARLHLLKTGKATYYPSGDYNGKPGERDGKDLSYAGFWTLVDAFLPDRMERRYLGLAANQMDKVREHIFWHPVHVVERNEKRYKHLEAVSEVLNQARFIPEIKVTHGDIFDIRKQPFPNIIDLDLMCIFPKDPGKWLTWLGQIEETSVINITTCVGRSITDQQHFERVENFQDRLKEVGLVQKIPRVHFRYRDKATPMRSERFVLEKEKK